MIKSLLTLTFVLLVSVQAYAQVAPSRQELRQNVQGARQELKENRQDAKQELREVRDEARQKLVEVRQSSVEKIKAAREEAREAIKVRAEEFRQKMETAREELKNRIAAQKEELKKKMQAIKDNRKKEIVERVYDNVNKLNDNLTERFAEKLNQIEKVLQKVKDRTATAKSNGRDVTAVESVIVEAEGAIASARTAVEAQAGKTYEITINTEAALRTDVGAIRKALHDDLEAVRQKVVAARDVVHRAAIRLAQIPRVDDLEPQADTSTSTSSTSTASGT